MRYLFFFVLFNFLVPQFSSQTKVIHVIVALCDNESQGIVPVPAKIGDGNNPSSNLYWGCGYGVRNFFDKKTDNWVLLEVQKDLSRQIIERLIFRDKNSTTILVADAWRGNQIKSATEAFFESCAGSYSEELSIKGVDGIEKINLKNAELVCYVGHDGLMDFNLPSYPKKQGLTEKKAIMLACTSSEYFADGIKATGTYPLLWTRGLMAPEAYTLEAALTSWVKGKSDQEIESAAEQAYLKYQNVKASGARWLFKTGW